MATITAPSMLSRGRVALTPRTSALAALATLARRRFSLSARTPREIIVPLMTPVSFAVVIAPALRDAVGGSPYLRQRR